MVIRPSIEYAFYTTTFSIPDVREMNKLLIKVTKAIHILTTSTLNICTQLPQETFGTEACSLLPRYATTMSEHLTQTLNDPCPLGQIYQGLMKFIVTKYGGVEYLPLLKPQACVRSPTKRHQLVDRTQPRTHNKLNNLTYQRPSNGQD